MDTLPQLHYTTACVCGRVGEWKEKNTVSMLWWQWRREEKEAKGRDAQGQGITLIMIDRRRRMRRDKARELASQCPCARSLCRAVDNCDRTVIGNRVMDASLQPEQGRESKAKSEVSQWLLLFAGLIGATAAAAAAAEQILPIGTFTSTVHCANREAGHY